MREHVRELTFFSERSDGVPKCAIPVLHHILANLPHLKIFEMNHLDFCNPSKTSAFARGLTPVPIPLRVDAVDLKNVLGFSTYYGDVVEAGASDSFGLAEFLNIFEEIHELRLDNGALPFMYPIVWHLLEATPKPLSRQTALRVDRIHLSGQQSAKALGVLQDMVDMGSLKELSMQLSPPVLQLADEFLSHVSNLEHIHISLRRDVTLSQGTSWISSSIPDTGQKLSLLIDCFIFARILAPVVPALANCSRLRTVRVSTIAFLAGYTRSDDLLWQKAVGILQCAPRSLQRVVLDIVLPAAINDEFVQDLDWAMFNAMLARADQLEEVSMLAAQKLPWTKQMQSAVQSKLSAGAQKLLQFGTFAMA